MNQIVFRFSQYHNYSLGAEPCLKNYQAYPNYVICKTQYLPAYEAAATALLDTVNALKNLGSDAERVRKINDIVCDKLTYVETASAMPNKVFTSSGVVDARCTGYTHAFAFLCDLVNIPCITIHGNDHSWNQTYIDGQWLITDPTFNDFADDINERNSVLLEETETNPLHIDEYTSMTLFAKELLIPGSTK